jgi:hypothetical protein
MQSNEELIPDPEEYVPGIQRVQSSEEVIPDPVEYAPA